MASLQKHRVKGRTYWRIVESRRINGKPRPIPIMHLGTADALLNRLLQAPSGQLRIKSFQHGDVASLLAVADPLNVVATIDKHVPESRRGLSVGATLLLAALNRAIKPRSRRAWADWAKQTSLHRVFPDLAGHVLTSQFFWDQMDCVSLAALRAIEDDLTQKVVAELELDLDTLCYDGTNFFTYIASTNPRPKLPQRGHSKQKRTDLRIFSVALLVSRDGRIPICKHVYEGNKVDAKSFPDAVRLIQDRLDKLALDLQDITIVYDKGNLSKQNQALVDAAPFSYVTSLVPSQHRALLDIPIEQYRILPEGSRLEGIPVLRLTRNLWGHERTLLLFVSEQLRAGQIRGLKQHLTKCLKDLAEWKAQLAKPRSGSRTTAAWKKKVQRLLAGQHIKDVLHIRYHPRRNGSNRLEYWIDEEAKARLEREVFGKRIIMTDRKAWADEEILLTYRGQSDVEDAFRQLKDSEHMAVRPQFHWTDQKIHVHTFVCHLGLLLGRVLERKAEQCGWTGSLSGLLDHLATIRLAMVLLPSGEKGGRPRCQWQMEEGDSETVKLFRQLVPDRAPFVYTGGSA